MQVLHDIKLNKYTTFKVGGICKNFYIPETEKELIDLVKSIDNYRFIGSGSNLLINDEIEFDNVILLKDFSDYMKFNKDKTFEVSSAVLLSKFINFVNEHGYGGIEYLYSIPGLIGGAIYMNAGSGVKTNCFISQYVVSVRALCLDDYHNYKKGDIIYLSNEECDFKWRSSVFKNNKFLILSAVFKFEKKSIEETSKLKKERIDYVAKAQDRKYANFGSVFCVNNASIMKFIKKIRFGSKNGVHFSNKTQNWLVNTEGLKAKQGAFKQTIKLINKVKRIHNLFHKKCQIEVIIWDK